MSHSFRQLHTVQFILCYGILTADKFPSQILKFSFVYHLSFLNGCPPLPIAVFVVHFTLSLSFLSCKALCLSLSAACPLCFISFFLSHSHFGGHAVHRFFSSPFYPILSVFTFCHVAWPFWVKYWQGYLSSRCAWLIQILTSSCNVYINETSALWRSRGGEGEGRVCKSNGLG